MTIRPSMLTKLTGLMLVALMATAVACSPGKPASESGDNNVPAGVQPTSASNQDPGENSGDGTTIAEQDSSEANFEEATGALFLEMTSPNTDELFVTQNSYEFAGRTTVDALLSVNDHVLEVDEQGRFAFALDLEEGPNIVEVVASNSAGEQYDKVLLVIYEPV